MSYLLKFFGSFLTGNILVHFNSMGAAGLHISPLESRFPWVGSWPCRGMINCTFWINEHALIGYSHSHWSFDPHGNCGVGIAPILLMAQNTYMTFWGSQGEQMADVGQDPGCFESWTRGHFATPHCLSGASHFSCAPFSFCSPPPTSSSTLPPSPGSQSLLC